MAIFVIYGKPNLMKFGKTARHTDRQTEMVMLVISFMVKSSGHKVAIIYWLD